MVIFNVEAEKKSIRQTMKKLVINNSTQIDEALDYLCENIILLPPNGPPIKGIKSAREQMIKDTDDLIQGVGGKSIKIDISEKADLAWEYGSYNIDYVDSEKNVKGYYLSIFKKQKNTWKLLLHSWSEIK